MHSFAVAGAAATLSLVVSISEAAQADPRTVTPEPRAQGEVIVTASRIPENAEDSLASVTVIDRAEIERRQARTLDDLLRGTEGLVFDNSGGLGKVTQAYLRGTDSDHTLWLVDGVRIGTATNGWPSLQDLPLDAIDRIEIVRGPRSSLYGADAIGGVVQIFTRRGAAAGFEGLRLTGGSHGTYQGSAAVSLGGESAWLDLQLAHLETDGINACLGAPFPPGGGCFTFEPDRDPYENTSANVRAGLRLPGGLEADLTFQRAEGEVSYDGSFVNESDILNQVAGIRLGGVQLGRWRSSLTLGRAWDEATNFADGVAQSVFDTRRDTLTWQNDFLLADGHTFTAGFDYLEDSLASTTEYVRTSRWNRAAFAQYAGAAGRQRFSVAARYDDNEQFGSHVTGSAAWGLELGGGLHAYGSVGSAFKAPGFNDLYFPGFSNPELDPERAVSAEIGLKAAAPWGRWSVAAYRTAITDLIAFDATTSLPANVAEARITGLDAHAAWYRGPWSISQRLSLLEPENRSAGPDHGNLLLRRPELTTRTDLTWRRGRWDLGAALFYAGRRYDDLANTRRLGGYATLDLTAAFEASPRWLIQARLANALDRDYHTAYFYQQPGREAFLTVRYRAAP